MVCYCRDNGFDYLAFRFWIGIWVSLALLIMVMFDLSALVRYITRFTEESFAMLIALIFIYEAFKKLFHILDHHPVNLDWEHEPDFACWCVPKNATEDNTTATAIMTTCKLIYIQVVNLLITNTSQLPLSPYKVIYVLFKSYLTCIITPWFSFSYYKFVFTHSGAVDHTYGHAKHHPV